MRLKKKELLKNLSPQIFGLGFMEFKDTIYGTSGLFIRRVQGGLYLSIAFNISRLYDSLFTCDLYLSRTTRIGCLWGDIPLGSYTRPGFLLTQEERESYVVDGIFAPDIWWDGAKDGDYDDFIRVLQLALPRFTADEELIRSIYDSKELESLYTTAQRVRMLAREMPSPLSYEGYKYLPPKKVDNIPMTWFCAAEKVLTKTKSTLINRLLVIKTAADAYRQELLDTELR